MKNLKYIIFPVLFIAGTSCGDEFLEQKQLFEKLDDTYYKTPNDVAEALAGAYACLPSEGGFTNPTLIDNLLSDDCFAGGGINDIGFHDIDGFTNRNEDTYLSLWDVNYKGIFRTNMLIKRFDQAKYTNEVERKRDLGEAHFLRAYFYFTLARFFGTVPLVIDPGPVNLPKAPADELFAQIASDMKKAVELMPAVNYTKIPTSRLGHTTKWAAQGLMARIFLFYTGFYQKSELPLAEGGSISKAQVISWLDECIKDSGHKLIPDFRNLWPYAYANKEYPYAIHNNLQWIGEDGANTETVFAIKYSVFGGWNAPNKISYSNQIALYMGMRGQENLIPFGTGWGAGPVNPQLLQSFEAGDIRLKGSIADVNDTIEGNVSSKYVWGVWECMHETGLWQKKYTPIQVTVGKSIKGMYFEIYGSPDNFQLWNMQDEVLLRFSDVLLMAAELGSPKAQEYLDAVRARVGLPSVPVTLDNIKRERRNELAFEGLRFLDLMRWHDLDKAFSVVKNVPVKNLNVDEIYNMTYRNETKGFLPIPESQIKLQAGVLEQNEGWK